MLVFGTMGKTAVKRGLNSAPIDELGNWCHPRLVGVLCKYQAQQGGSMATL